MITKIGIVRTVLNFFGERETRAEERSWNVEREHVLKAIKYAMNDEDYACAHFDVDGGTKEGGTHEVVYNDHGRLMWDHWVLPNAKDTREVTYKEIRRISREWMEEHHD